MPSHNVPQVTVGVATNPAPGFSSYFIVFFTLGRVFYERQNRWCENTATQGGQDNYEMDDASFDNWLEGVLPGDDVLLTGGQRSPVGSRSRSRSASPVRRNDPKRPGACVRWCFTYNNYPNDFKSSFIPRLRQRSKLFIFQQERGDTGTPHLQGYAEFQPRQRLTALVKHFPGVHWEVAVANRETNVAYCSKLDSRDGDVFQHGIRRPLQLIEQLRPWQQRVVDRLGRPADPRHVYWYWDPVGNVGKTALAKYLSAPKSGFNCLYVSGKTADIEHFLTLHFDKCETNYDDLIVIFDLSRAQENYMPYTAIEQIKNGIFFSGKYESSMQLFNPPHILCFANFTPDRSKLSEDRWKVIEVQAGL